MTWVAVVLLLGQTLVLGVLAWILRTFGRYTAATLAAHESNLLVYRQAVKVLEYAETLLRKSS
jgi:hypothetical protein